MASPMMLSKAKKKSSGGLLGTVASSIANGFTNFFSSKESKSPISMMSSARSAPQR